MNEDESITDTTGAENHKARKIKLIKRIGIVGFILFLIKGLLWLLVPYLIAIHIFK